VTDTVCVVDVPVPVTVIVDVPSGVVASVATVSVELSPAVMLVGTNVVVAPSGRPLADNVIVSGGPAVDTRIESELPWTMSIVVGDALIEKSGCAFTTNDTVVVCVAEGAVPVIVTV